MARHLLLSYLLAQVTIQLARVAVTTLPVSTHTQSTHRRLLKLQHQLEASCRRKAGSSADIQIYMARTFLTHPVHRNPSRAHQKHTIEITAGDMKRPRLARLENSLV